MQKSLVLGIVLAMSMSASAFASSNPFTDVPAGHWAYASIAKLAAAGIIDGYGDGTYRGDRLMTRYEMAQIVAKAMAKGANVDRLASEFADELDSLGVRVAKLEKKSDNVKITGQARVSYADYQKGAKTLMGTSNLAVLRSRLFFDGKINDNWNYQAALQNIQNFSNNSGDEKTDFQRAFLYGRLGGTNVTAGRYHSFVADGNLYDCRCNGIKAEYGDRKAKITGEYGRFANSNTAAPDIGNKFYRLTLSGTAGALDWEGNYIRAEEMLKLNNKDETIWTLGVKGHLDKAYASAMYLKSNVEMEDKDHGFVFGLGYGGAQPTKVGSWGVWTKHYDQPGSCDFIHTMAGAHPNNGFKGWGFGADYTIAKNMVLDTEYYKLSDQLSTNSKDYNTWWSHIMILF
jgi:hypothetical protein